MMIVYVKGNKQFADTLTHISCLNHVVKAKIQADWWSKMTQATKEDEEMMRALQVEREENARGLAFYKQRI